eukprot:TRINITY_DN9265_c0_g2_i2.p1 TRINITY_DN9265_c0_g2~~TRINITY_DN9265_c0_g2_i2.p1  ORF type:complete len:808 (+),score=217.10 TRINITY_DN9265_c0_g2_i2:135-2558(+)
MMRDLGGLGGDELSNVLDLLTDDIRGGCTYDVSRKSMRSKEQQVSPGTFQAHFHGNQPNPAWSQTDPSQGMAQSIDYYGNGQYQNGFNHNVATNGQQFAPDAFQQQPVLLNALQQSLMQNVNLRGVDQSAVAGFAGLLQGLKLDGSGGPDVDAQMLALRRQLESELLQGHQGNAQPWQQHQQQQQQQQQWQQQQQEQPQQDPMNQAQKRLQEMMQKYKKNENVLSQMMQSQMDQRQLSQLLQTQLEQQTVLVPLLGKVSQPNMNALSHFQQTQQQTMQTAAPQQQQQLQPLQPLQPLHEQMKQMLLQDSQRLGLPQQAPQQQSLQEPQQQPAEQQQNQVHQQQLPLSQPCDSQQHVPLGWESSMVNSPTADESNEKKDKSEKKEKKEKKEKQEKKEKKEKKDKNHEGNDESESNKKFDGEDHEAGGDEEDLNQGISDAVRLFLAGGGGLMDEFDDEEEPDEEEPEEEVAADSGQSTSAAKPDSTAAAFAATAAAASSDAASSEDGDGDSDSVNSSDESDDSGGESETRQNTEKIDVTQDTTSGSVTANNNQDSHSGSGLQSQPPPGLSQASLGSTSVSGAKAVQQVQEIQAAQGAQGAQGVQHEIAEVQQLLKLLEESGSPVPAQASAKQASAKPTAPKFKMELANLISSNSAPQSPGAGLGAGQKFNNMGAVSRGKLAMSCVSRLTLPPSLTEEMFQKLDCSLEKTIQHHFSVYKHPTLSSLHEHLAQDPDCPDAALTFLLLIVSKRFPEKYCLRISHKGEISVVLNDRSAPRMKQRSELQFTSILISKLKAKIAAGLQTHQVALQ